MLKKIVSQLVNLTEDFESNILNLDELLLELSIDNKEIELLFDRLLTKYGLNPIFVDRLLTYLQLNDSETIDQYSLDEVKLVFDRICSAFPLDLVLHAERYYFYRNIFDKEALRQEQLDDFSSRLYATIKRHKAIKKAKKDTKN